MYILIDLLHLSKISLTNFVEDDSFRKTFLPFPGFSPQLAYNIALCNYMMRQYPQALKYISDVIENGIREHPELGVGMTTEGIEVRSVGMQLAFNLFHSLIDIQAIFLDLMLFFDSSAAVDFT